MPLIPLTPTVVFLPLKKCTTYLINLQGIFIFCTLCRRLFRQTLSYALTKYVTVSPFYSLYVDEFQNFICGTTILSKFCISIMLEIWSSMMLSLGLFHYLARTRLLQFSIPSPVQQLLNRWSKSYFALGPNLFNNS